MLARYPDLEFANRYHNNVIASLVCIHAATNDVMRVLASIPISSFIISLYGSRSSLKSSSGGDILLLYGL